MSYNSGTMKGGYFEGGYPEAGFFDIDDFLVAQSQWKMPDEARDALERFKKKTRYGPVLATGRPEAYVRDIIEKNNLDIDDFIAENGGITCLSNGKRMVYRNGDNAMRLREAIEKDYDGGGLWLFDYGTGEWVYQPCVLEDKETMVTLNCNPRFVKGMEGAGPEEIRKAAERLENYMLHKMEEIGIADKGDIYPVSDAREFVPHGLGKPVGMENIAGERNIDLDRSVAGGDNFGDLPMLRRAGFAITVDNAPNEIKEIVEKELGGYVSPLEHGYGFNDACQQMGI